MNIENLCPFKDEILWQDQCGGYLITVNPIGEEPKYGVNGTLRVMIESEYDIHRQSRSWMTWKSTPNKRGKP